MLLPRCGREAAARVAEKIRAGVREAPLSRHQPVTVSIGVTAHVEGESFDAFVARADTGLYASKRGGRDRVTLN